jgi:probable rRNA maturation factor
MLGDIVISVETLHRRCRKSGEKPGREFARLLVHGALHLINWDHSTKAEREAMRQLEDGVIDTISGKGL